MNITNQKVTDYITAFYQPLNASLAELRKQSESDGIPLILRETEMLFRTILPMRPYKRVLEIGTAYGYSSLFFAHLMPKCRITTVELSDTNYQIAKDNVWEQNMEDRIEIIHGDGISVLDRLIQEGNREQEPFDLIFIDAAKSHYMEFFQRAEKICGDNGVIICDNILMKAFLVDPELDRKRRHRTSVKRMDDFLNYIFERKDLNASLLSCGDGILIVEENHQKIIDREQTTNNE